jgi:AbrB family looped-hinge helix DNA binding protein
LPGRFLIFRFEIDCDNVKKSLIDGVAMKAVTVSSKFQVVIPRELRESMGIRPGARFQVLQYENRLELIPIKEPQNLRGFIKGIDTAVNREEDRV